MNRVARLPPTNIVPWFDCTVVWRMPWKSAYENWEEKSQPTAQYGATKSILDSKWYRRSCGLEIVREDRGEGMTVSTTNSTAQEDDDDDDDDDVFTSTEHYVHAALQKFYLNEYLTLH